MLRQLMQRSRQVQMMPAQPEQELARRAVEAPPLPLLLPVLPFCCVLGLHPHLLL